jgi:hypothetical protein
MTNFWSGANRRQKCICVGVGNGSNPTFFRSISGEHGPITRFSSSFARRRDLALEKISMKKALASLDDFRKTGWPNRTEPTERDDAAAVDIT